MCGQVWLDGNLTTYVALQSRPKVALHYSYVAISVIKLSYGFFPHSQFFLIEVFCVCEVFFPWVHSWHTLNKMGADLGQLLLDSMPAVYRSPTAT